VFSASWIIQPANTQTKHITNTKIEEKGTLKATEHDKYENIAGSVWLSMFMGSNGYEYYWPHRLAPGWAQLNIYTK
jgi:hypothetical protein